MHTIKMPINLSSKAHKTTDWQYDVNHNGNKGKKHKIKPQSLKTKINPNVILQFNCVIRGSILQLYVNEYTIHEMDVVMLLNQTREQVSAYKKSNYHYLNCIFLDSQSMAPSCNIASLPRSMRFHKPFMMPHPAPKL